MFGMGRERERERTCRAANSWNRDSERVVEKGGMFISHYYYYYFILFSFSPSQSKHIDSLDSRGRDLKESML